MTASAFMLSIRFPFVRARDKLLATHVIPVILKLNQKLQDVNDNSLDNVPYKHVGL